MKKILTRPIFILIVIGITLSGVTAALALNGNNLFNWIRDMGDEFVADGSVIQMIDKESTKAASEMIMKTYAGEDMQPLSITRTGSVLQDVSISPRSLYAVNRLYPVEHLRLVNDSLIYAVYRIQDTDLPVCYMYLFFEKLIPNGEFISNSVDDLEKWYLTDRVFFISKKLQIKDFTNIVIGSDYKEVLLIDPLTAMYRPKDAELATQEIYNFDLEEYVIKSYMPDPVLTYQAYYYCIDGIVCISFERDDAGSEFKVKNIGFNDTFELPSIAHKGTTSMRIDSIDFPRE